MAIIKLVCVLLNVTVEMVFLVFHMRGVIIIKSFLKLLMKLFTSHYFL